LKDLHFGTITMRLFVSVDLPDDHADAVRDLQNEFRGASGLNVTDPEQAHVTLKFLGDTPERRVDRVSDAIARGVEAADVDPFAVEYGGLGVFPDFDYISVLWLGVRDGGEQLTRLHEEIEAETTAIGFDPEDHEFTPHVTLARMEHAGGKELVQETVRTLDPTVGKATVEAVHLTESELTHDGPVYSTVERFPL
jgi:2'-5' RNA ligase